MKTAVAAALVFLFAIQSAGTRVRGTGWGVNGVHQIAVRAYQLAHAGKVPEALALYESALVKARHNQEPRAVSRLLASTGGAKLALSRYRPALLDFLEALRIAENIGDGEQIALCSEMISATYLQLYDVARAAARAERASLFLPCVSHPSSRASVLLNLGWIRSLQGRREEALALYADAVPEAESSGVPGLPAACWNRIGCELLDAGRLDQAERALSQAFRTRLLSHDPNLYVARFHLARLRLAQGDAHSAENLLRGVFSDPAHKRLPPHHLYHLQGRIREALGDLPGAVDSFRQAVAFAAQWRGTLLPSDSSRVSSNAGLDNIYRSFIDAAVRLSQQTHSPALLAEAWQAAEFNRAASLRESIFASPEWRKRLPADYWESLAELRSIEARNLNGPDIVLRARLAHIRAHLTELESQTGISSAAKVEFSEKNSAEFSLSSLQKVLGKTRMLVSYHLGEARSYRWTTTGSTARVAALPPAAVINKLAGQFRSAVLQNEPNAAALGHRLYATLFDGLEQESAGRDWLLALEGNLFNIPFPALVTSIQNGRPQYLIESRTIQIVPGAWAVGSTNALPAGRFLGIGDPVYNRADTRYRQERLPFLAALFQSGALAAELPRLIGSGQEIQRCARSWQGPVQLLTGAGATRDNLIAALADAPAVIHIAAHFVASTQTSDHTMVAFSLTAGGHSSPLLELLTNTDVSTLHVPGSLVVLSGCSSAAGASLPGAGLLGLTRAWLSAGAGAVIASHWPTPDDSGELFLSFYSHLGQNFTPAEGLRQAQLAMLHSRSWRSSPRYWAAFQIMGRSNGKL